MPSRFSQHLALAARRGALALAALVACNADEPDLSAEPGDDDVALRLASDPSTASSFGWCPYNAEFGGVDTEIRYPTATNCNTSVEDSPLVLLLHGAGYDYDTYDYLLEHLARNGIIAVSADILANELVMNGHATAAAAAEGVIDDLLANWPKGSFIDPTRLAIVGHSRGGQTARHLAERLKGNADPWTVRAVVGLASKAGSDMPIDGDVTTGLLLLQGTSDNDQIPERAYELYDGSGHEDSVPMAQPDELYRAMKLLQGANHSYFSGSSLGGALQRQATKGFVWAFLALHLLGDPTWYEDYVRGVGVPGGWTSTIVTQVSDGYLRKVIDNFEAAPLGVSTLGGAVSSSPSVVASVVDLVAEPDTQHETHALRMSATIDGDGITWTIPAAHGNTLAFKYISMRIGQISGAAASDLAIQIQNDSTWLSPVAIADYGPIPQPMNMCSTPTLGCSPAVFDHMGTVRVPFDAFSAHDDVEAVRIVFTGDAVDKHFLLDSLEFAEFVWKP